MSKTIASYKLGSIQVTISETENPNRLLVDCNDGNFHSDFTVSSYEYQHYKRHMNQKITNAYREQYQKEDS